MEASCAICLAEIPEADWAKTPESVKKLVQKLIARLEDSEAGKQDLQGQVQRNLKNSSQPPSQDQSKGFEAKGKGKRARGGQKGHEGHGQRLYPAEECRMIEEHYPSQLKRDFTKIAKRGGVSQT